MSEPIEDLKTACLRAAERWPDRPFLHFDATGERLSFARFDRRSNAIGNALAGLGVEPGDKVGVMLRNCAAHPLTWVALSKIGATMVPLNVFYKHDDASYLLAHSEAVAVVTSDEFVPLLADIAKDSGPAPKLISVDGDAGASAISLAELAADKSACAFPTTGRHLANIQYTSGTTGKPKGCMLSNAYWLAMAGKLVDTYSLAPDEVMLTAQPFYYMDPQWQVVCALLAGCRLVALDRFHPSSFWARVRELEVTWFYCLGAMPTMLMKMPPDPAEREHKVRMVMCSAIPPGLHKALEERWGVPWFEAFGMTETGGDLAVSPEDHDALLGTGSIGRPLADREVRIANEHGEALPPGKIGEMLLRGPNMMDGYFQNEAATKAAHHGDWFRTGDRARMDEQGRVYYVGRLKEMIRRSGENISAGEVEETIASHPSVRLAACIPVPDELRGEEVKAFVVLQPGARVSPAGLAKHCLDRLAYFKVPRYWTFRDDLPRTPSERIAKPVLAGEAEDLRVGAWDRVEELWR
ncbi:MAG: AMP-binding protein [Alphaproteobacteria bacterium]